LRHSHWLDESRARAHFCERGLIRARFRENREVRVKRETRDRSIARRAQTESETSHQHKVARARWEGKIDVLLITHKASQQEDPVSFSVIHTYSIPLHSLSSLAVDAPRTRFPYINFIL
jgi:hypothetical protein